MLAVLSLTVRMTAHEGMWIPAVLGAVYDDMKAQGLKLSKEDLYSVNNSSLKDGIVLFGGGCTAEIVSDQGLLFTNHHCGFDYIQFHSSVTNDYLTNGFWAKDQNGELVCKGLSVTFVLKMEDITDAIFLGVKSTMSLDEIENLKKVNKSAIEASFKKQGIEASVKAFNYGNQYFAIYTKTYRDVRLVGAPPSAVGKFGGDTDNWVWPRHTGDFSMFRIYADENNEPADYNPQNKPYNPAHYFPVNIQGVKEGDYSMVYGFPGRTEHLLTSYSIDYVNNKSNPMRIKMRETSLDIIGNRMKSGDKVRIQYAAKQSSISNAYKKWVGQEMGLSRFQAYETRKNEEQLLISNLITEKRANDQNILPNIELLYKDYSDYLFARDAFVEYVYYGPEIFSFAHDVTEVLSIADSLKKSGKWDDEIKKLKENAHLFYKDFDLTTEKMLFTAMSPLYSNYVKDGLGDQAFNPRGSMTWEAYAEKVYGKSMFRDSTTFFAVVENYDSKSWKKISKDPVYMTSTDLFKSFNGMLAPKFGEFNSKFNALMYRYVKLLTEMKDQRTEWCDANSTLRISFGKVEGSAPRDGMQYTYFTTADGILEKYNTGNPDFELPDRLVQLLERKAYQGYDDNGQLRVCYTASNHTTGGNSGSPALNAKGELVGINFDRSWESTMSDMYYNPDICRNIMVDIRYVLWIIDVYAEADYLINEMKIVR
ncbi:MAG: hypothetical protein RLZZ77_1767 [Bacteroidota bacterium]